MVELQILCKVLNTKDYSIIENNYLTEEFFPTYREEYSYIKSHYEEYKNVPDIETFITKFPEFERVEVNETDRYLVNTIREERLYTMSVPVIKKAAELLKADANEAGRYIQAEMSNLVPNYEIESCDIIHSRERFDTFKDKLENKDKWFIPTGFEELDDALGGGAQCGEELIVVVARTGNCKSWVITKIAQHSWLIGKTPGYMSPEMSGTKIGYRFDTVNSHFSNSGLNRGDTYRVNTQEYESYIDELNTKQNSFYVTTPRDFNNKITVTKLKNWVKSSGIDVLFIDGITYLSDERYKNGDNKTTSLTNISEDLMQLSCELRIPIYVVVQSNRGGVDKDAPDLEDIRDSDGIAHNATRVISVKHKDEYLSMIIKKNREYKTGVKIEYLADIDTGEYTYVESGDDVKEEVEEKPKKEKSDKKKVVF